MTVAIHGGKGGDGPARELHRTAGLPGCQGAESLASPPLPGKGSPALS